MIYLHVLLVDNMICNIIYNIVYDVDINTLFEHINASLVLIRWSVNIVYRVKDQEHEQKLHIYVYNIYNNKSHSYTV